MLYRKLYFLGRVASVVLYITQFPLLRVATRPFHYYKMNQIKSRINSSILNSSSNTPKIIRASIERAVSLPHFGLGPTVSFSVSSIHPSPTLLRYLLLLSPLYISPSSLPLSPVLTPLSPPTPQRERERERWRRERERSARRRRRRRSRA